MVHAPVSNSVATEPHQTALRDQASFPFREGDGRRAPATPQKPLRADGPAKQNGVLDPRRVTALGRRGPRGIETSVGSGRLPAAASATVRKTLGRRAASVGRSVRVVG